MSYGYNIVRKLGKGGMASVFEVEQPTLGAHLAMKVFEAEGERRIEAMIAAMLKMYE